MQNPTFLAYDYCKQETGKPTVLALHGLGSDCLGGKIQAARSVCLPLGVGFCCFDYPGHGQSGGVMANFTLEQGLEAALCLLDEVITGPVIIMGSSTGGWLALLLAQLRPERVKGLLTIANACDFTEDLFWAPLPLEEKAHFATTGAYTHTYSNGFSFTVGYGLIENGRKYLLFGGRSKQKGLAEVRCPVRLLHGMADDAVPWQTSLKVAKNLGSSDVTLTLTPHAGHQFSSEEDLRLLQHTLMGLLTACS